MVVGSCHTPNWHCVELPIGLETPPQLPVTPTQPLSRHTPPMYLPTLYKARKVPTKQPVCVICVERTRGKTVRVRYGYGVEVWLCEGHASPEFQRQRRGRDLVLTLTEIWRSSGCLTISRHRAMDAHLNALKRTAGRPRPGSYAWPELRRQAERLFADGVAPGVVARRILAARFQNADPPSLRTVLRWHAERRWLRAQAGPVAHDTS
jgi:hypothetical protein